MINYNEMPQNRLLSELKDDVDSLRRKLVKPDAKSEELILEIESLKESIHELTIIFQKAVELTREEDLSKTIKDKLDAVIRQNETIAKGMLAISDKVDEFVGHKMMGTPPYPASQPMKHSLGQPPVMNRLAPMPNAHAGMDEMQLPPPPPMSAKRRQGIF